MKKLILSRRKKKQAAVASRITNETVAEHRERILAGGRRFKYPIQYARHKLVINTIAISLVAAVVLLLVGWWQLYPSQSTNSFFYKVTRVLPLPVARVDGELVRYSDYLMQYRSSTHIAQQIEKVSLKGEEGQRRKNYYKRVAMDNAISETYAQKLANDLRVSVSDDELNKLVSYYSEANGSQLSRAAYMGVVKDMNGYDWNEYLRTLERHLLRQKVSVAVDKSARDIKNTLETTLLKDGSNFEQIAKAQGDKVELASSGLVNNNNSDGGRAAEASKLEVGQVSKPFISRSIDGYYIVKLVEKNDKQVSYLSIKVPLTEFSSQLNTIKKQGKVDEYISISEVLGQIGAKP